MVFFDMISLILPALISIIVRPTWSNPVKLLTAFGVSVVAAFLQVLFEDGCSITCFADLTKTLFRTFTLVMTSYAAFWRMTGLAQQIEAKING